jgi:chemotaxis protein methyltransferase CheR
MGERTLAAWTEESVRPLTAREFEQIRSLAHQKFGLDLRDGKQQLVSARLGKKIRESRFRTFQEYYRHVVEDRTGEALAAMIDALTTNYTSFFRESAHFDFLRSQLIPLWRERPLVRVWSAACATGEEAWSLAVCLAAERGPMGARVLATDISTRALAAARKGIYPAERCESIPKQELRAAMLRGQGRWERWYSVRKELRATVDFERLNLMEPFAHLGTFPVIFCRNVMIYFNKGTQEELANRLAACLEPGGYLFIGHAESLTGIGHPLQYVRPAIYRKRSGG